MAGADKSGTKRPKGRTLAEFGKLHPAERKLLAACAKGELADIGEKRPEKRTRANRIRPEFLRFLALGGDGHAPVHEQGVQVQGAWIDGYLDLQACRVPALLSLWSCNIAGDLTLRYADLWGLNLEDSRVQKIRGDGLHCRGNILLRNGFHATGEVRLPGALIGGDLACRGGRFENANGDAFSCDKAEIGGSVFLDAEAGKEKFHATGAVRLLGAHIGGNLDCSGGRFESAKNYALICERAEISGALFFQNVECKSGVISLIGSHVHSLIDDPESWPRGRLLLDGFRYDSIVGDAPTDAKNRIQWLDKQPPDDLGHDFKPQPWEQLVKVLREMGHDEDAKLVAIEKQARLRRAGKIKWHTKPIHWLFGFLAGYGYRPMRTVFAMFAVWLVCAVFYFFAAWEGVFAPSNPRVFAESRFEPCTLQRGGNWTECDFAPLEHTAFSPWIYSLDLILPVVDLQQDKDWAPMIRRPHPTHVSRHEIVGTTPEASKTFVARTPEKWPLGVVTRFVMWFEILFGWLATSMLVAALSVKFKKE